MAESSIKLYGGVSVASSYSSTSDLLNNSSYAGVGSGSNFSRTTYCEIGPFSDPMRTSMHVYRNGANYSILNHAKKIIMDTNFYPSTMSCAQDAEASPYNSGWVGSHNALPYTGLPGRIGVTFPCAGNYKINFQASAILESGSGNGAYMKYKDHSPAEIASIVGQYMYGFYCLRLGTVSGDQNSEASRVKWIAVSQHPTSSSGVSEIYNFTITESEFTRYGPKFNINCYLTSSNGCSWSYHGTQINGACIFIEFA